MCVCVSAMNLGRFSESPCARCALCRYVTDDSGGCAKVEGAHSQLELTSASVSGCVADGPPVSAYLSSVYSAAPVEPGGGGGLAAVDGGHLELTDTSVTNCTVGNQGAALLVSGAGSTAVLTRVAVRYNHAGTNAAVAAILGGSISLVGGEISLNSAGDPAKQVTQPEYGTPLSSGLLAFVNAAVYADGTTISRNKNSGTGGAATAWSGHMELTNLAMRDNTGDTHIGCVGYVASTGMMDSVELDGCWTPGTAGALCVYASPVNVANTEVKNSHAGLGGGAWYDTNPPCSLYNVKFDNCDASNGGALKMSAGVYTLESVKVSNSRATVGGGLSLSSPTALKSVVIEQCTATDGGGGMYVTPGAEVTGTVSISGSRTLGEGASGGCMAATGGTTTLTSGTSMSGCESRLGGLVAVSGPSVLHVSGATLSGGLAGVSGGCVHGKGSGSATFTQTTFDNCEAINTGAGFMYEGEEQLTFDECEFSNILSTTAHGGMGFMSSGAVTVRRSIQHDGNARAGAACVDLVGGQLLIESSSLRNAHSSMADTIGSGHGGCLWARGGVVEVSSPRH